MAEVIFDITGLSEHPTVQALAGGTISALQEFGSIHGSLPFALGSLLIMFFNQMVLY